MEFKVVSREEVEEKVSQYEETDTRSGVEFTAAKEEKVSEVQGDSNKPFYKNPELIRRGDLYYIGYENDLVEIAEWEAVEVYNHPETVFDVIISHRRKFYFNTAEDSIASLANGGYTLH